MQPTIQILPEKKLIGKRQTMSFANNTTGDLWKSFMPRRKEILNNTGTELYSMQLYPPLFFNNLNPNAPFDKWAAIEVTDFEKIPPGMETFTLEGGLYAVFQYKGAANDAAETFQYILGSWLPASKYLLDTRPHFEILGDKYKKNDADSEEEIWIPIKEKA